MVDSMLYQVQATVTLHTENGLRRTKSIPTFYLDSIVQGIVSVEHCRSIVVDILNPFEHSRTDAARNESKITIDAEIIPYN